MKISQSWILAYDRVLDDTPTLASGRFITFAEKKKQENDFPLIGQKDLECLL